MRQGIWVVALALVAACGPEPRGRDGDGDGGDSDGDADGDDVDDSSIDAALDDGCGMGTELVYVIDQFGSRITQFNPMTKVFTDLGSLNTCAVMAGASPFSMSVDRQGRAWVLYTSGELMVVEVNNGFGCTKLPWTSPNGLKVFGMGFSTDAVGSEAESLYIGGGTTQTQTSYTLARVDPNTMAATVIGTQPALPEMTGNGNAELWGFMPEPSTARVVRFDKTNGTIAQAFTVAQLAGNQSAYAFAHWGGDYWVFLQKPTDANTTVYQVDGTTGAVESTTPAPGRTIVGAGVSTCAPTVVQ
jgi:hypothetical protein